MNSNLISKELRNPLTFVTYVCNGLIYKMRWCEHCWILEDFEPLDSRVSTDIYTFKQLPTETNVDRLCRDYGLVQAC